MRYLLGSLLLFVASAGFSSSAATAAPVVVPGSTYTMYLQGAESGDAFVGIANFDDVTQAALRGNVILNMSESQTDLGDGKSLISIQLRANGDLFPVMGETAIYNLGIFDDGLDLSRVVSLYDTRVSFFDLNDKLLEETDNLASVVNQNRPWDGLFPSVDTAFETALIGGRGVTGMNFDFYVIDGVTDIPEPASLLLSALGVMAMRATRRRHHK